MKTSTKIWLGVGAFVVAGSAGPTVVGTVPASAEGLSQAALGAPAHAPATSAIVLAQAMKGMQHGGEAGEAGGEKGAANLPPDLKFALAVGQLRGHLLVGDQLVSEGKWKAAMPHFLHPIEEIYGEIRGQLKDYNVPPFETALKVLSNAVKQKKAGATYSEALKTVQDVLVKADAGLKGKQPGFGFTVESAVELIKSATGEYEEAVVKGRIAKPVEYQDARGYIWEGERMLKSVAADAEKKDKAAYDKVQAKLTELKAIFPTATPPKKPLKSHEQMVAIVSQIELAAGPLM
jgi:hypothetical protein